MCVLPESCTKFTGAGIAGLEGVSASRRKALSSLFVWSMKATSSDSLREKSSEIATSARPSSVAEDAVFSMSCFEKAGRPASGSGGGGIVGKDGKGSAPKNNLWNQWAMEPRKVKGGAT